MKLAVRNAKGRKLRQLTVDDTVFGITPNMAVLHQAFVAQRANQRRGSASTKSRSEVQGSTRKIRGQKYTGRARQGTARSPVRVGGGVAFGPRPRSYRQALPKKMKRLAIRSALSGKVADGQLHVVDKLGFKQPRTKDVIGILHNVGIERSALIVTGEPDRSVLVGARNIPKTKVLPAAYLNVLDMLTHRDLLLTVDAVRTVEGLWGTAAAKAAEVEKPKPKPRRRRAPAAEKPAVEAEALVEEKPRPRRAKAAAPKTAGAKKGAAKPGRRTRRTKAEVEEKTAEQTAEKPKPARRRSRAKPALSPAEGKEEA